MASNSHSSEQLFFGIQHLLDQHFEKLEKFIDERLQPPQKRTMQPPPQQIHLQVPDDITFGSEEESSEGAHAKTATGSRLTVRRNEAVQVDTKGRRASVEVKDLSMFVRRQKCSGIACPCLNFINSTWCEMVLASCILANTILFGAEVEYRASTLKADTHPIFEVSSHCFFAVFLVELVVRILLDSNDFFVTSKNLAWNYFDLTVVAFSAFELIMSLTTSTIAVGADLTYIRVLRMLKMVRVMRVVRLMRFFRPMRLLVHCVLNTVKSLTWTVVLLLVILFLFGVLFTQASTQYFINDFCKNSPPCPASEAAIEETRLFYYWGSIWRSIFTLFKTLTGGVSWQDVSDPLADVSFFWAAFFVGFISFCYLAVLNIVTGIVFSIAIESATEDLDMQIAANLADKEKYTKQLTNLFQNIDIDHSGHISLDEIQDVMKADPEGVSALFDAMEITVETAWELFQLLDTNGSRTVGLDEFVEGCLRLRGNAKAADIHLLMHESKLSCKKLATLEKYFEEDFLVDIREQLANVLMKQGSWVVGI